MLGKIYAGPRLISSRITSSKSIYVPQAKFPQTNITWNVLRWFFSKRSQWNISTNASPECTYWAGSLIISQPIGNFFDFFDLQLRCGVWCKKICRPKVIVWSPVLHLSSISDEAELYVSRTKQNKAKFSFISKTMLESQDCTSSAYLLLCSECA